MEPNTVGKGSKNRICLRLLNFINQWPSTLHGKFSFDCNRSATRIQVRMAKTPLFRKEQILVVFLTF